MERTKRFIEELENNDCEVYVVEKNALKDTLVKIFRGTRKIFYRPSDLIESLNLGETFEMVQEFEEEIRFGLTEADFGIVYSGGLVELAMDRKDKLPSLLPEVHVAILKEENVVEDF